MPFAVELHPPISFCRRRTERKPPITPITQIASRVVQSKIGFAMDPSAKSAKSVVAVAIVPGFERTLEAYGAELFLTDPERRMLAAIEEPQSIRDRPGAWMPNQFDNPANPL